MVLDFSLDFSWQDADKLVLGYMLVFVYVNLMLSKMNCVEQRIGLSIVGILRCISMMMRQYVDDGPTLCISIWWYYYHRKQCEEAHSESIFITQ